MRTKLIALLFFGSTLLAAAQDPAFIRAVDRLLSGTVPTTTVATLNESLRNNQPVVLIDVRDRKEFDVSHIKNAVFVDELKLSSIAKDSRIVVYCSVGYRSEKFGEKLLEQGYKQTENLYGGIFAWVNEGHPVVAGENKVTLAVHPYSDDWARWLVKGKAVYE